MSVRWMDHIIRERRDLRGAELTCALIIANYASVDDRCYPGLPRIAEDLRCTVRQAQVLIRRLELKGVFKIIKGSGRGNRTQFEFIKDEENNTVSQDEKAKDSTPLDESKRRSSATEKGEGLRKEKVKICAGKGEDLRIAYKDEPSLEPSGTGGNGSTGNGIESVATELAISETESAFRIKLDLETRQRIQKAIIPSLIHLWPQYVNGRAVGWTNKSPTEKLRQIGYALTDFQKENKTDSRKSARNGFLH